MVGYHSAKRLQVLAHYVRSREIGVCSVTTRYARLSAKLAKFYGLQQRLYDLYLGTSTGGGVRGSPAAMDPAPAQPPIRG